MNESSGRARRPTIADVARRAGVSTVTVTRVFDRSARVSPERERRVREAVEELGYFGNGAASSLVSGRFSTVGVIASDTLSFGYAKSLAGIEDAAREARMAVLISVAEGVEPDLVRSTVALVLGQSPAGVIVLDYDEIGSAVLAALPAYVPVVAVSPATGPRVDRPYVAIDEYTGGRMAARHLLDLGHRTIHLVAPPNYGVETRTRGVRDEVQEAGAEIGSVVRAREWSSGAGREAMDELLAGSTSPVTAVFCGNDEIALGVYQSLRAHGLRIPEDVSVVGFDDNPVADFSYPRLTTVDQDFMLVGRHAFGLLERCIAAFEEEEAEVPAAAAIVPELRVRDSTAPPRPGSTPPRSG
ncbi:LacI family DNA-binding transcriptional regulator [Actinotalea sp.]|uniref:LacI family DNA-binding transcriptional regulator n=1 Tax=Actinotalea sp. TaxID=1872145 RepID=UPI0035681F34